MKYETERKSAELVFCTFRQQTSWQKKARNFICIIVPCFYSCACDNGGMVYRKRYGKY